ncbi:Gfo/Idh/MocA family protein [Streptomyces sp. NPDC059445]|uniref:Gfo/Idh/MocA family protein n=1 Tax=Streptomyces sp. NPDC059445 TaxID=3346832 RepID=UPI0036953A5A
MRVGIVGAGGIGHTHARAVAASDTASLAGVFDLDQDKAWALAHAMGTTAFTTPADLYEAADGVVIASPNRTHADYAHEAIATGLSVLCEKPMAVSLAQATGMRTLAADAPGICAMGFNYRYLQVIRETRRHIDEGTLGRILHVDVAFKRASALTRKHFTWRDSAEERLTSGALGDLGVHLIDLLHFLFGGPVDPAACQVALRTKVARKGSRTVEVDDHTFVSGRLRTGPSFTLTASKASQPHETGLTLALTGTRGELTHDSKDGPVLQLRTGVDWEQIKLLGTARLDDPSGEVTGWADSFVDQLHDWTRAVTAAPGPRTLADFEDGHRAQQVLQDLLRIGARG